MVDPYASSCANASAKYIVVRRQNTVAWTTDASIARNMLKSNNGMPVTPKPDRTASSMSSPQILDLSLSDRLKGRTNWVMSSIKNIRSGNNSDKDWLRDGLNIQQIKE